VTKEDKKKAVEEQFGGEDENPSPTPGLNNVPTFKFTKYSNAYMLVYVRESDWGMIQCEVKEDDIAPHLRERLKVRTDRSAGGHVDAEPLLGSAGAAGLHAVRGSVGDVQESWGCVLVWH
jgi:hypothetical protein